MLDVGSVCDVHSNMFLLDNLKETGHIKAYEELIRLQPNKH
jgi:hypothetical protein